MTREIACPFRNLPEDAECETVLTVTLTDEVPPQVGGVSKCARHPDGGHASMILEELRPGDPSRNPHIAIVVGASSCPWCDGTGMYAQMHVAPRPRGSHKCEACSTPLGDTVVWVPCGYCQATGLKAA